MFLVGLGTEADFASDCTRQYEMRPFGRGGVQIDAKRRARGWHGTAPEQRIPQNIRASESPSAFSQGPEQADG